ncbi:unnamed protein product [Rodentolepis nana]|uniref:Uncharacterized protein n=1 Tax=Rodentolepis nana TaxID=102285 RepID=A0A0R3TB93_RODNA|nr:unnamed protein product [Rodentolepis nana]
MHVAKLLTILVLVTNQGKIIDDPGSGHKPVREIIDDPEIGTPCEHLEKLKRKRDALEQLEELKRKRDALHINLINTIECFGPNTLRKLKESGTPFATLLISVRGTPFATLLIRLVKRDALRNTADQTGDALRKTADQTGRTRTSLETTISCPKTSHLTSQMDLLRQVHLKNQISK